MQTYRVVILQDCIESINEIVSAIDGFAGFTVVGSSCDGEEGLELISKLNPDFILMGIVLKNFDGFAVMEKLRDMSYEGNIVVISSFTNMLAVNRAMSLGTTYYLAKPFKAQLLQSRLKEITENVISNNLVDKSFERKANRLDERISKIFISVGIPPHIKGYQYLREGVKMAVDNPDIINNITKKLYPMIGEKYDTSASKVERAIRHAIEVAWNRGRIETINTMLGIRAYIGNEKPTNGEFIALIADKMILEGA
ncbi:MAG: sporulation transcription factor Spo0A [Clostridia bacterium]|nr:sporulation transcription factor Spo0A [Clostridia bacterium]